MARPGRSLGHALELAEMEAGPESFVGVAPCQRAHQEIGFGSVSVSRVRARGRCVCAGEAKLRGRVRGMRAPLLGRARATCFAR
eukprot:13354492-Alexandrium_andersonii.AAC.1